MSVLEEKIQELNYSDRYQTNLWIPRVGGIVTVVSCSWVIYDILIKRNSSLKNTATRIIVLMSVCDVLFSFFYFVLGTVMVPAGLAWGSHGNQFTCTLQGFITILFSGASTTYNAVLAVYFLLVVRNRWRPQRFETLCCRFWFLIFPLAWRLLFGIIILLDGALNYDFEDVGCYIAPSPLGCVDYSDIVGECQSGTYRELFKLISVANILITTVVIVVTMILLWIYISTTEKRSHRHDSRRNVALTNSQTQSSTAPVLPPAEPSTQAVLPPAEPSTRPRSTKAAKVGFLYCGTFVLSTFPFVITIIYSVVRGSESNMPHWMWILLHLFQPLQGFFNALVYAYRQSLNRN